MDGNEPAGYRVAPKYRVLDVIVYGESYAPCVAVEFSTVIKYMSFLCGMFSKIFPPDFTESNYMPGVSV